LRGTDGLGAESWPLWHYLDIESAFDDILNKTTVTVLAPYNEAALDIAIQMASGIKQVVTSNGGQAQLKKGTGMDGQMSWKWAKVFSPAPEPDVTSLIEEMISQAEGGLGSDVRSEVAKYLFANIKTATSPLNVEAKSRNLNNNYKPTIFYPAPLPIVHWTQVFPGDSSGQDGSSGQEDSSSSGAPSALPLVGAATSNDVLTLRTGPTVPTALQPGAQLRVSIEDEDHSEDDPHGDPVDDNVGDQDPVVVQQKMAGLRGRPEQTRGGQTRGRRGRAPGARGLGGRVVRDYTFDVTQVSGPYSNGTVEVQVKEQVPGPLSQAVSDSQTPLTIRILPTGDDSGGGSDNGSDGGSDDDSNGGSDGDSNGDNNASIGPGVPSPQPRSKFVAGVSNVTVFTAGGVLLTGLLAALFDEDPLPPQRRR
jgi:hypothetical protein